MDETLAEMNYAQRPESHMVHRVCHELTTACVDVPPEVPASREPGLAFIVQPKDERDLDVLSHIIRSGSKVQSLPKTTLNIDHFSLLNFPIRHGHTARTIPASRRAWTPIQQSPVAEEDQEACSRQSGVVTPVSVARCASYLNSAF